MPAPLHPAIADALARGFTVLTANQRSARAIRELFGQAQSAAGLTRWTPPPVFAIDTWLAVQWHQRLVSGDEVRNLLNTAQEHVLWRHIISSDPAMSGRRSANSLADMAARAWFLLCMYGDRENLGNFPFSADTRAFERWSKTFADHLRRDGLVTAAQLPYELTELVGLPTPPLALADFDSHAPAFQTLFEALRSQGTVINSLATAVMLDTTQLATAEDDSDELRAAAFWIRNRLAAHPSGTIAVVVPGLAVRRAAIDRIFGAILCPNQLPITTEPAPSVYEFSLGFPLSQLSITRSAVDLLQWTQSPLSIERISAILLSPWFSSGDTSPIAQFDAFELRRLALLRPELSLDATVKLVQRSRNSISLTDLIRRLRAVRDVPSQPAHQPFARWAQAFRAILEASGWTRSVQATSLNFQQHRRFDGVLDQLATLDGIGNFAQPSAHEALVELTRLLHITLFAPESQDAPVQILGPLELGGVTFDALWFLGADDFNWPPTSAPSPLLPRQLQLSSEMPGISHDFDAHRAASLTRRISQSASHIVFSYARNAEDGERRVSPALATLNLQEMPSSSLPDPPPTMRLISVPDDLPLPALPTSRVRGGARVLKLQAACAFRAFAELRLWSTSLDTRELGFDAIERGNLVHAVMQLFWNELHTQEALRSLSEAMTANHLAHCIDLALAESRAQPHTTWDDAYVSIQRQRLHDLLTPWLRRELDRADFTVQPTEQEKSFQAGPLTLNLRIDRIDTTSFGEVILDYKTGEASPSQWAGDRPDEPQLPLYASLAQQEGRPLAAVAFVLLRRGKKSGISGFAEHDAVLGRKPTVMEQATLHDQVAEWGRVLGGLADGFARGDTRVLPKEYPKTCRFCEQRILCRLNPELLLTPDGELDDSELESELAFE